MNKLIIPFVIVAVAAVGSGIFFVFQKPVFPGPRKLLAAGNGGYIQQAEKPSLTVSAAKLKPSVGAALSRLKVSGNRIVTEGGQEIRLRGVNFTDPFLLEKDDLNGDGAPDRHFSEKIAEDFARVKKLGANVVRLAIYPGYYRLVGDENYLTTYVDRAVDLAEKNGLYIIISYQVIGRPGGWYDAPSDATLWQYPAKVHYTDSDMAVAFWNKVAARYGQRNHALFEIYNEPADETADFTWADWRPTGQLLIDTVRKHSNNLVLGSGPKYSNDLSAVPENPYSGSNIVYVAHVYPGNVPEGQDQAEQWQRSFGFLAKTYPVIVSEWGFSNGGDETTKGTLEGYGKPLLDYLDQKNIHWTAFVYHPMDPGQGQMLIESDWTTLTEFGEFVKQRLQPYAQTVTKKDITIDKKPGELSSAPTPSIWSPELDTIFQLQFSGDFNSSVNADVYDLDLFGTSKERISMLHAQQKKVICYTSVGSWENWRPDKDAFPAEIIGKDYAGWPGEKWLDIRRIDLLGPVIKNRFDMAKEKGCDAIDPDNLDGFNADSGFPLTYADQRGFNTWLAKQAHQRGMSIGLKNDPEQIRDLLPVFDWALIESCHNQGWCEQMAPFVSAGKAVFQVEYTDASAKLEEICPAAKKRGFIAFLKHRNLDAWAQRCR